jgi:hypothetical protein
MNSTCVTSLRYTLLGSDQAHPSVLLQERDVFAHKSNELRARHLFGHVREEDGVEWPGRGLLGGGELRRRERLRPRSRQTATEYGLVSVPTPVPPI